MSKAYIHGKRKDSRIMIGIDEVNWGAVAGPLVVCAVAIDVRDFNVPVMDSKELTEKEREILRHQILERAMAVSEAWVMPRDISENGVGVCLRQAYMCAYAKLPYCIRDDADRIVIDGSYNHLKYFCGSRRQRKNTCYIGDSFVEAIVGADKNVAAVAAASVVAKADCDEYINKILDPAFPEYDFKNNKCHWHGKCHPQAVETLGPLLNCHHFDSKLFREKYDSDGNITELGRIQGVVPVRTDDVPPPKLSDYQHVCNIILDVDLISPVPYKDPDQIVIVGNKRKPKPGTDSSAPKQQPPRKTP